MAEGDQKTERPTPRRIDKARRDGQFAVSSEWVAAVHFLTAVALLAGWGASFWRALVAAARELIALAFRTDASLDAALAQAARLTAPVAWYCAAAGGILAAAAVLSQFLMTGFGIATKRLQPDWSRVSPWRRLRQLPWQNTSQLLRALLFLPAVAWLTAASVVERWPELEGLSLAPLGAALGRAGDWIESLLWQGAAALLVVGLVDLHRQRSRYFRQLRMSKHDIRQEAKELEGNPQMKARIRRIQRDLSRRRMMTEVETATAVVVNPTHYAVALRYLPGEGAAPKVVAKGRNYLAARIRAVADRHGVPIVENPPLAQALYQSVEAGQEIPAQLYRAVAEVLAYIYRVTRGRFGSGLV